MLKDKGLIVTTMYQSSHLGEEMSIYMPNSVRNYLKDAMENNASKLKVEFMLIKNYCDKFKRFYLQYKNSSNQDYEQEMDRPSKTYFNDDFDSSQAIIEVAKTEKILR